jgi:hypothetical protein
VNTRDAVWLCYAGVCACVLLVLWLIGAEQVSKRHIPRRGGRPYLVRRGRAQTEEDALHDRVRGTWRMRLHNFVGPDDAGHHNHPFLWSFSIVLSALWGASYTEEVLMFRQAIHWETMLPFTYQTIETRRVRFFNWIPITKYHRVTELHSGLFGWGVWTLFITGPRVGEWGFWDKDRGHVPHATYSAEHGNISTLEE